MKILSFMSANGSYLFTIKDDDGIHHTVTSYRDYDNQLKVIINNTKYEVIDFSYIKRARL